ncbi:MAG: hypothetical protein ACI8SE_001657 [Bacteroidia bacterium]|jgi:hypothetical protein
MKIFESRRVRRFYVLILFGLMLSCNSNRQKENSVLEATKPEKDGIEHKRNENYKYWTDKDITSATLYVYYPEGGLELGGAEEDPILNERNELNPYVLNQFTKKVDEESFTRLKNTLIYKTDVGEDWVAACFLPYHGFVLKNRADEIVGHISICFMCHNYQFSDNHVQEIPLQVFESIVTKTGAPIHRTVISKLYRETH